MTPDVLMPRAALDRFMPMHVHVGRDGKILHAGPTLLKVAQGTRLLDRPFLEVFTTRRPARISRFGTLMCREGQKLSLQLNNASRTPLKGVLMAMGDEESVLIDLAFDIAFFNGVSDYGLSGSDFAHTDMTIEMLYLIEANMSALSEWRNLNLRVEGARIAAQEQAFTDTLTGLKNRRALDHVLSRCAIEEQPYAILQVDLDFFKEINDTHGHAAGDHTLQAVARVLVECTRQTDTVARVGGDEFVLLLSRVVGDRDMEILGQRIIEGIEDGITFNGQLMPISASIGGTMSALYADPDPEQMLRDADAALYASKNAGRGRITVWSPPTSGLRSA